MPATYEPIASVTMSAASQADFSSIPSTYTDLRLVVAGAAGANVVGCLRVGTSSLDTGTNYSNTVLLGDGSAASSARYSTQDFMRANSSGTLTGQFVWVIDFMSYANTNVFKTVLSAWGGAGVAVGRDVGLWRSTGAIGIIRWYPSSSTFTGTASLYGIKAA